MEQFAEKFVLRIWRLTNGVVGLGLFVFSFRLGISLELEGLFVRLPVAC